MMGCLLGESPWQTYSLYAQNQQMFFYCLLPSIIYSLGMLAFIITGYNYGIWQKWLKHFCTGTFYMYQYMCDFFYKGTELLMKIMFYYYYDIIGNFMIFYWHWMIFDWHLIVTVILKFVLIWLYHVYCIDGYVL